MIIQIENIAYLNFNKPAFAKYRFLHHVTIMAKEARIG